MCIRDRYGGGAGSFLLNIIWLIVSGLPLALEHLALGAALCVTIIGIPFGLQQFKLAKLALMPFGAEAVSYTHLDVYKRQVLPTGFSSSR